MKEYSTRLYKIIILVLLTLICWLMYENFYLIESMISVTNDNTYIQAPAEEIPKYGYSDMLDLLSKDSSIKIINISNDLENIDKVKVDIEYNGTADCLYNSLQSFKGADNFCYVDNIKINMDEDNKKIVNATLCFIKNK